MQKESVLVVGLGEVGIPLLELLNESGSFDVYGFDIDNNIMKRLKQSPPPEKVDTIHICIPCYEQRRFVDIVVDYAKKFIPKLLIMESTVQPATTAQVAKRCRCLVAHSPVRGVHESFERMKADLKKWTKYVGGTTKEAAYAAQKHFEKIGLKTRILKSCAETELAKLFETTYRAWMIACFQEMHRISSHFGADFDDAVDFLEDTHRVRLDRPVMFPDVIGGHCLIPNIVLLQKSYPSQFLDLILNSNEKRKNEVKDRKVKEVIEKVKSRAKRLQKELMRAA